MIEHNDFNNELLSQCGDENSYTQDDSFLDSVNLIIEELEAKEQNEQPLKKKVKKVEENNDEYEFERLCIHKKYGCYQCRNDYKGTIDIEYHEKLNNLFNRMKRTILIINKTVT